MTNVEDNNRKSSSGDVTEESRLKALSKSLPRALKGSLVGGGYNNLPRASDGEWTATYDSLLDDAKVLLRFAVESGISIEPQTIQAIASAQPTKVDWASVAGGNLLGEISKLIDKTKPVTATAVRTGLRAAHTMIAVYRKSTLRLAAVIIPISLLFFINNGLSDAISQDVKRNNEFAVSITSTLNSNISNIGVTAQLTQVVNDLPVFASTTRAVAERARILSWIIPVFRFVIKDDTKALNLELPVNLVELKDVDEATNIFEEHLRNYQIVRDYATRIRDVNGFTIGAVTNIILPSLYALLGAYAFLLRQLADNLRTNTFIKSELYSERLIIAGIAGIVVGLFSNFNLPQAPGLSPLAVAFLVGYASDIFFSFLDALMRAFTSPKYVGTEHVKPS